ncbi:hypothetical protein TIFTF001_014910 [Ficus carica]|uniref:Uncharacterized protein n=1 Tax=Ficus carica TaxID=3494 RepID=A0AA87ZXR5_FICCA|nr:hypothetical protein TIFTF001_014910 [Ficus carica]
MNLLEREIECGNAVMKWEFQTRIAEDGDEERSAAKSRRESEERERGERKWDNFKDVYKWPFFKGRKKKQHFSLSHRLPEKPSSQVGSAMESSQRRIRRGFRHVLLQPSSSLRESPHAPIRTRVSRPALVHSRAFPFPRGSRVAANWCQRSHFLHSLLDMCSVGPALSPRSQHLITFSPQDESERSTC